MVVSIKDLEIKANLGSLRPVPIGCSWNGVEPRLDCRVVILIGNPEDDSRDNWAGRMTKMAKMGVAVFAIDWLKEKKISCAGGNRFKVSLEIQAKAFWSVIGQLMVKMNFLEVCLVGTDQAIPL